MMKYFEHPKFQFLLKILEAFKIAKVALCIDRHDRQWILIDEIERQSSGCGQCHSSYDVISISGSLMEKKKNIRCRRGQYYTNTRQIYSGNVKQYDMHPCYPHEEVGDDFLFDIQDQYFKWGIRKYFDWNDLIRQYHLLTQNQNI